MSKIRDKIKPLLTIIVPVALILLASAMITGCGEDPNPLAENTAESSAAIKNTESPAIYETTATEPPTPPPFDPKNVEIVENPTDSSMSSPLIYTTWEGLPRGGATRQGRHSLRRAGLRGGILHHRQHR